MSIQKTTPWIHYSYKFQLRGMLKCQETHLIHHLSMNKLLLLLPIQISEECLYGTDAFDAYQLPLPDPKKWEFCVLSTTYFFIYLWQHNLVFKKFLEVTWNNLNNKTPPYHHDTVTLQVPKPKFTNTKRLSTQLPPLLYYHGVHYKSTQPQCHQYYCCHHFHLHHSINSPPSLTNIVLTKQGNGLYNGPLTMDTENCYPPPQKTIKKF